MAARPFSFAGFGNASARSRFRGFLLLSGVAVSLSAVVLVEPAPADILLLALLAVGIALHRLAFVASHRLPLLLLVVFFAANAISLTAASDYRLAIEHLAATAYLAFSWVFFVGATGAYGGRAVDLFMKAYAIAACLSAAAATLAFFHLIPFANVLLGESRAKGLFKDPNVYGPYLIPVLLYGFALLSQRLRILSAAFSVALATCITSTLGVLFSFSRAAWINCAVSMAVFLGFQFISGLRHRTISKGMFVSVLAIVIVLGALVSVAAVSGPSFSRMLADRLGNSGLHNYDNDRFSTQHKAFETSLEEPLGIGPGQSEVMFDYSTHNMYLRVLVENGFVGFAAFYVFVLFSLIRASRMALLHRNSWVRSIFALVSASIVGLLINGVVIDTVHWRHFWFLLALAWWTPGTPVLDSRNEGFTTRHAYEVTP